MGQRLNYWRYVQPIDRTYPQICREAIMQPGFFDEWSLRLVTSMWCHCYRSYSSKNQVNYIGFLSTKGNKMANKPQNPSFKPGQIAPASGQYLEVGPKGGTVGRREVTSVKGEPLPPTTQRGSSYRIVDRTRNQSGRGK